MYHIVVLSVPPQSEALNIRPKQRAAPLGPDDPFTERASRINPQDRSNSIFVHGFCKLRSASMRRFSVLSVPVASTIVNARLGLLITCLEVRLPPSRAPILGVL